jgi:hypothetical protein
MLEILKNGRKLSRSWKPCYMIVQRGGKSIGGEGTVKRGEIVALVVSLHFGAGSVT